MTEETLTTQNDTQDAATTEATPAVQAETPATNGNADHMIPKARFDEINEKFKALEAQQTKAAKDAEAANRKALEEQNNFKALYEKEMAEKQEAIETAASLQVSIIRRDVADAYKIPSGLVSRLQGSTKEEIEADAKALMEALPAPTAPKLDGLANGGKQGKPEMSDIEKQEMAAQLGIAVEYLDI